MKRRVTTSLLERNPHQSTYQAVAYIMHYISLYKNVIVVRSGTPPIRWNQNFTLITGLGRTPTMLKSKGTLLSEQAKPAIQSIHTYLGRVTARIYTHNYVSHKYIWYIQTQMNSQPTM